MHINLCGAILLGALLWASFASAEDTMCDNLDGVISEVESGGFGSFDFITSETLRGRDLDIKAEQGEPRATLPGTSKCIARVVEFDYSTYVWYQCEWAKAPPRSAFLSFQNELSSCLGEGRFSEYDSQFVTRWKLDENMTAQVSANKVQSKGMFLTFTLNHDVCRRAHRAARDASRSSWRDKELREKWKTAQELVRWTRSC